MQKSPRRVLVGVLTMALLGFAMTKGYEAHQVSSAKALTSENWGLGFSAEGEAPTANETPDELKQWDTYYIGNQNEKKIYLTAFSDIFHYQNQSSYTRRLCCKLTLTIFYFIIKLFKMEYAIRKTFQLFFTFLQNITTVL